MIKAATTPIATIAILIDDPDIVFSPMLRINSCLVPMHALYQCPCSQLTLFDKPLCRMMCKDPRNPTKKLVKSSGHKARKEARLGLNQRRMLRDVLPASAFLAFAGTLARVAAPGCRWGIPAFANWFGPAQSLGVDLDFAFQLGTRAGAELLVTDEMLLAPL